ncbi:MAG: M28 family peptidase [Gemmatimonadota bacterium]
MRAPIGGGPARLLIALCVTAPLWPGPEIAAQETGGASPHASPPSTGLAAAAERYMENVRWLAADERGGRKVGSPGIAEAADWLQARFEALGLEPAGDAGTYRQAFRAPLDPGGAHGTGAAETRVDAYNIVGRLLAGAENVRPGTLVIGAHYDHLGMGGFGSLEPDTQAVHNGADDNASGTAALLEVSRLLADRRKELRRDVYVVAFSGEEEGTIGSTAFVNAPPAGTAVADIRAMLNMDMVGRLRGRRLSVLGGASAQEWPELVGPACEDHDLICVIGGDGFGSSDQNPFFAAGVPVLHFFTGAHSEYHRPSDDADLINAPGAVSVARLVADVALAVAARETPLTLVAAAAAPQRERMRGGARLGTIPDYAGPADGSPGLLLSAVRPDSPAEKGGLRRGDLIVRIDDEEIAGIEDFMRVLQAATPGQKARVTVIRGGERVELAVTYGARR